MNNADAFPFQTFLFCQAILIFTLSFPSATTRKISLRTLKEFIFFHVVRSYRAAMFVCVLTLLELVLYLYPDLARLKNKHWSLVVNR